MSQLSAATVAKFRPELILNSADPDGPAMNPAGDQEVSATQLEMAPRRIPNLGHALLFVGFAGLMLVITQLILLLVGKSPVIAPGGAITIQYPKWQLAAMATTYLTTLLAAWLVYPVLWRRAFLVGLGWHWETARGQAGKLLGLGLFLGVVVQFITYFITTPKNMPMNDFFQTQSDVWLLTLFGTIVAPLFEEICFRGFLLPAIAIAYDWLSLPRTPEARIRWQTTTTLTPVGMIFAAVLSSIFFAGLHAEQVAHAWAVVVAIFSVSLVLTFVRVKTQSVAASTLVHSAYNSFVFLTVMIATGGYRHLDRMTK